MDQRKFMQFNLKEQNEIEDIYYDGCWNIVLKNHDRVLSEDLWGDVKWQLKQMVKRNDFTLCW